MSEALDTIVETEDDTPRILTPEEQAAEKVALAKKYLRGNGWPLYDVLVRLGGSRHNEVLKRGVTAPEVMILGAIHGGDGLVPDSIKKSDPKTLSKENLSLMRADRPDGHERARLAALYESVGAHKQGFVQRVFGPTTIPLPREIPKGYTAGGVVELHQVPQHLQDAVNPAAALMS